MKNTISLAALGIAAALALPGAALAQQAGDGHWQRQDGRGQWNQGGERYRMHERDGRDWRHDAHASFGRPGEVYGYQHYRQPRVVVQRQVVVRTQPVYPAGYGYGNAYYGNPYGDAYYGNAYGAYSPWQVGGYYTGNGYAPTYVVNDYNSYGLYAPPRGYAWRRDDFGHYMLVALASGLISQLIMGR